MGAASQAVDLHIEFEPSSPKYLCVVGAIIAAIRDGRMAKGCQLPSINELSEAQLLARDTVEKAYKELRQRGIIQSVKGKGYYVSRVDVDAPLRILLVFNKISNYKKQVYHGFVSTLGFKAVVDLQIHHSNVDLFDTLIQNSLGSYDYYVVMPHFYSDPERVLDILGKIPQDKLLLLDKDIPELRKAFGSVYQDFKQDIFESLEESLDLLAKYNRLVYVNPSLVPYPAEIRQGFSTFCRFNDIEHVIWEGIDEHSPMRKKDAYIVIEETDLANLIKYGRQRKWILGKDFGILSYNETPIKEILQDGISVISTEHELMGISAAHLILEQRSERIKNPFSLRRRKSL